jgi:plasmid stabilization system protein ParE
MTYSVEIADVADAEIEAAFLRLAGKNPAFAGRWLEGLLRAIGGLDTFPRSHAVTPESAALGREVRRMLYRNGQVTYRVLFCLVDADEDGIEETVRVLHIRHGAQRLLGEPEDTTE